jgi:hypothetical protein
MHGFPFIAAAVGGLRSEDAQAAPSRLMAYALWVIGAI